MTLDAYTLVRIQRLKLVIAQQQAVIRDLQHRCFVAESALADAEQAAREAVAASKSVVAATLKEHLWEDELPDDEADCCAAAAVQVALAAIDGLTSGDTPADADSGGIPASPNVTPRVMSSHDSSDTGTKVPYLGQWERDLYGDSPTAQIADTELRKTPRQP